MTSRAEAAVEEWKRERPDLDPFVMQVLGRLGEAAQTVARDHLTPFFVSHGLQPGEFDVLATLRRSGHPYALNPTALYEATMISSGGMTNRLDRLEKAELIERKKHPKDRRGTIVELTKKGRALIDDILELHIENERRVLSGLTRSEQEQLDTLLSKLLKTLPK